MQTGASTLADLCNLAHEDKEDLFVNFEETSILHNPIHSNLGGGIMTALGTPPQVHLMDSILFIKN